MADEYAVVVGSINIDLIVQVDRPPKKGESVTGNSFSLAAGGKGGNQAAQLAKLGHETQMIGCVGKGRFSDYVLSSLRSASVSTDHIGRVPQGTGKGCVLTVPEGDNWIVVVPGANAELNESAVEAKKALIQGASVLITQLEVSIGAVARAVEIAAEAGVPVVLNPSPVCDIPASVLSRVTYLIPNQLEAATLSGMPVSCKKQAVCAAEALREQNKAMTVIVTLGEKGVVYVGPDTSFSAPALKVQAVDTTAAGDSFCGAFCYGLMQLWPPQKAVEFAVAASAITVTGYGTQPSLPNYDQVSHLLATGTIDL